MQNKQTFVMKVEHKFWQVNALPLLLLNIILGPYPPPPLPVVLFYTPFQIPKIKHLVCKFFSFLFQKQLH